MIRSIKLSKILLVIAAILLVTAPSSWGQAELDEFPFGTTTMVYRIVSEEIEAPQYLRITVTGLEDGRFQLIITQEAIGTPEELAFFGLLGGMMLPHADGREIDFTPLFFLMERRELLVVGEEFLLIRGGRFIVVKYIEIAGIEAIQGIFFHPRQPTERIVIAFSLRAPVFLFPRLRVEELINDEWVSRFEVELIEYAHQLPAK
ncbi:hypothetical protein LM599_07430 [Candidatus Acetothermia bacterium]|jgi:hypothetical protein|nr:hypothetical protein [Candidatus Acetothermia bacterium]MCI2427667.1 hypothetical protein [Candidatus Acetothermia bacterium]MCI2429001.1 hypothetical protein [Candidatus Acetothermia bacterium]